MEKLTAKQIEALRTICEGVEKLTDCQKWYLLGWMEGTAGKKPDIPKEVKTE